MSENSFEGVDLSTRGGDLISTPTTGSEGDRSGDLYDSSMGDQVKGGNVQFDYRGEEGRDHHTVYGEDRHFSWDSYPQGDARNDDPGTQAHGTDHESGQGGSW